MKKQNKPIWKNYWVLGAIGLVVLCCGCSVVGFIIYDVIMGTDLSSSLPDVAENIDQSDFGDVQTQPTWKPQPDSPPQPKNTLEPAPTATTVFKSVVLQGSGDQIVDIPNHLFDGGILHATHNGSSNFIILGYDAAGETIDLFVNTIGSYNGRRLFNQYIDDPSIRFSVEADGAWMLTLYDLAIENMTIVNVPGEYQGNGDDILALAGDSDTITANATGESNFIVYSYNDQGTDLIFNEIAPYNGTKILPNSTFILEILAEGSYTLTISQ